MIITLTLTFKNCLHGTTEWHLGDVHLEGGKSFLVEINVLLYEKFTLGNTFMWRGLDHWHNDGALSQFCLGLFSQNSMPCHVLLLIYPTWSDFSRLISSWEMWSNLNSSKRVFVMLFPSLLQDTTGEIGWSPLEAKFLN